MPRLLLLLSLLMGVLLIAMRPLDARAGVHVERGIAYVRVDGVALGLDRWADPARRDQPIAILVHGGGWHHGRRTQWELVGWPAALASRGFEVLTIDYRLACERSRPDELLCGNTKADAVADVDRAVAWALRSRAGRASSPSILLVGTSAGAHLALLAASRPGASPAIRGVVAISPPVDLRWFGQHPDSVLGENVTHAVHCSFERCPARWLDWSPMGHVATTPPLYVLVSDGDVVTPRAPVVAYVSAVRRQGTSVLLRAPMSRACHGVVACSRSPVRGVRASLLADAARWMHRTTSAAATTQPVPS